MASRSKRAETLHLTPQQVEALSSPPRLELLEAVSALGPSSAGELAVHLRRSPGSVFHHVRKLEKAGLLKEVHKRSSQRRRESVYDLTAQRYAVPTSGHADPRARRALRAVLRQAERDADRSLAMGPERLVGQFHAAQLTASLQPAALRRLFRHLQAIEALLRRANRRRDPQAAMFRWTSVLTPLERGRKGNR